MLGVMEIMYNLEYEYTTPNCQDNFFYILILFLTGLSTFFSTNS